ncbi:MAG: 3'(2'),5'-bisphosphate nucleotidase CysQ, partial [Deltaproteobacteria bacterium]
MDYDKLVRVMRDLALKAGDAIMEVYASADMGVETKADESPVTKADLAADAVISAGLRIEFPEIALVTEDQSASHTSKAKTFLIVDPLDGTKEFVQRRGDFTVNIALVEDGITTRGVVYAPAKQRLFYTDARGQSVEEDLKSGAVTPINVSQPDNAALMVVASKSHRDVATDAYIANYAVKDMTSAGSSLKF